MSEDSSRVSSRFSECRSHSPRPVCAVGGASLPGCPTSGGRGLAPSRICRSGGSPLPALMAPSPGTPVGGERAPRSPRRGAVAAGGMGIDSAPASTWLGDVPDAWFQAQGRQRCQVCGLSVSTRHGVHRVAHRHGLLPARMVQCAGMTPYRPCLPLLKSKPGTRQPSGMFQQQPGLCGAKF